MPGSAQVFPSSVGRGNTAVPPRGWCKAPCLPKRSLMPWVRLCGSLCRAWEMVGATSGIQDQQLTEQEDNSASSEETQRDVSLILLLFGFFLFFFLCKWCYLWTYSSKHALELDSKVSNFKIEPGSPWHFKMKELTALLSSSSSLSEGTQPNPALLQTPEHGFKPSLV